jgi:YbbR domain-containing protein
VGAAMKNPLPKLTKNKRLSKLLSRDWLQKVVSLLAAFMLWYFVGGEDKIDKNVMVPIEIINLPRDLVVSNQFKKEIEVTVSGPRSLLFEMANRSVTRQVDLAAAMPGTMVIENDAKHIPVPRGITVQRVQPSSIILSLDKLVQKQIPVEARTTGRVSPGYLLKSMRIDPEVITIAGPYTTLSQVDHFLTRNINLDGIKQAMQLQVPLELEPAIVELIGETSVTAELVVAVETVTVSFDSVPVTLTENGQEKAVVPDRVKVTANVPKLLIDKKVDLKTLLTAVAEPRPGQSDFVVKALPRNDLELPVEVIAIFPETVRAPGAGIDSAVAELAESIRQSDEENSKVGNKASPPENHEEEPSKGRSRSFIVD